MGTPAQTPRSLAWPSPPHSMPATPCPATPSATRDKLCGLPRSKPAFRPRPCESEARPCTPNQCWGHVRPLRTAGASGFPTWISAPGPMSAWAQTPSEPHSDHLGNGRSGTASGSPDGPGAPQEAGRHQGVEWTAPETLARRQSLRSPHRPPPVRQMHTPQPRVISPLLFCLKPPFLNSEFLHEG